MNQSKEAQYQELLKQLEPLLEKEIDKSTMLCNVLAAMKYQMDFFWIGIYYCKPDKMVLGPFQGMTACMKIQYGSGLCGTVANSGLTQYVNDVSLLTNYIACHEETSAEIVVPGTKSNRVEFVLDIDHLEKDVFDETDQRYLEEVTKFISERIL